MRIVSKWKDYYDRVSAYGVDPRCVYYRGKMPGTGSAKDYHSHRLLWVKSVSFEISNKDPLADSLRPTSALHREGDRCLEYVVAGEHFRAFLVRYAEREVPDVPPLFRPPARVDFRRVTAADDSLFVERWPDRAQSTRPIEPSASDLQRLVRLVGVPVFRVLGVSSVGESLEVHVDANVPRLAEWGFASDVPAEAMWQSIYTTLTSVLRDDPDKKPPVEVDNEHKIWAAGMDPKTSFRNPVNPKPRKARRGNHDV